MEVTMRSLLAIGTLYKIHKILRTMRLTNYLLFVCINLKKCCGGAELADILAIMRAAGMRTATSKLAAQKDSLWLWLVQF